MTYYKRRSVSGKSWFGIIKQMSRVLLKLMRGFQHYVSVPPLPYLRCKSTNYTFIRKINSVAYVKNNVLRFHNFAVAVDPSIHIGSSSIFPYLPFVRAWSSAHVCAGNSPACLLGLPRYTLRQRCLRNGRYGHVFTETDTGTTT